MVERDKEEGGRETDVEGIREGGREGEQEGGKEVGRERF